ncbi:Peptidase C1 and/or Propeptide C1 domain containing protein, partial [Asbolus verrucosus]
MHLTFLETLIFLLSYCMAEESACPEEDPEYPFSDDYIDCVNNITKTWQAGRNWPENTTRKVVELMYPPVSKQPVVRMYKKNLKKSSVTKNFPRSFDAREKWPRCESIKKIRTQGSYDCSAGWAVTAAATLTDRTCTTTNGRVKFEFSADDILTCCKTCFRGDNGCGGGDTFKAWQFWVKSGFVSGGEFGTGKLPFQGCKPYSETFMVKKRKTKCEHVCTNGKYRVSYEQDKHFGKSAYMLSQDVKQIQDEIMTNGPVQASFKVYQDFYIYSDGVYRHIVGNFSGYHSLKLIGWGVENRTPYWLAANVWGRGFGSKSGF